MQIEIFAIIVILVGIACQFAHFRWCILAMFLFGAFGGSAALTLTELGGATVTPGNFFLPFYVLRLVMVRDGPGVMAQELNPVRPMFIFFLLTVWAVLSAILLPRLFANAFNVFSLARSDGTLATVPLRPTSGNVSQAVYALGGFLSAWTTCCFCRRPGGYAAVATAVFAVSALDIAAAALDVTSAATGTGFILDSIRNGGYTFLTEGEISGVRRITGLLPEASVFASFTLQFFAANFVMFAAGAHTRFTGPASILLALFIAGSTSSAGYFGLGGFFLAFGLFCLVALGAVRHVRPLAIMGILGAVAIVGLCIIIVAAPRVVQVATDIITQMVLNKAESDSAIERGSWNAQAWQVFLNSYGIGAGVGSTRSSNYALVLLSNVGLLGAGLFVFMFLRATTSRVARSTPFEGKALIWGARAAIAVALFTNLVIGTVYDLGVSFYCLLGVCLSATAGVKARRAFVAQAVAPPRVAAASLALRSGP